MMSPSRYLSRMILFLFAAGTIAAILFPAIEDAFVTNVGLNGTILAVLLLGVVYIFRTVLMLGPEVRWLRQFQAAQQGAMQRPRRDVHPKLLAPMARMLGERKTRISLSALSMRSVLDGIGARLDESREVSRYLIGLLIFLGLLGTFWGLLQTVRSVGDVIGTLSVAGGDMAIMFSNLQDGLQEPLNGMGTAFSSSLFGLAGSLVLGFLELQATQAQNRFFQDVEDWLSGATRLSSGAGSVDADQSVPAYIQALLEQTAENIDSLQRTTAQAEEGRRIANANLMTLTEKLSTLTDQMRAEQSLMMRLAESLLELKPMVQRLAEVATTSGFGVDDATRQHIRNIDVMLARLNDEVALGRTQSVQEIRSDIKLIARTIAALAEEAEHQS